MEVLPGMKVSLLGDFGSFNEYMAVPVVVPKIAYSIPSFPTKPQMSLY